jgi:DNA repair protein RadA/Sms
MLIAVLEKRLGLKLGKKDIFLNIAGGIKVDDPAIDLAVLASIISSDKDIEIPRNVCFAAEVGLTGEIRPVFRLEQRIAEAKKLGFKQIFISKYAKLTKKDFGITLVRLSKVAELYAYLLKFFSTNK